jgi:Tfp pilus tip-associated adhesin PilY1
LKKATFSLYRFGGMNMKATKKSIMVALIKTLIMVMFAVLPAQLYAAASMTNYCLMPPYVKRDVKPNILIIMDNAVDMGEPAYCTKDVNWATNHYCDDNYTPVKADGTPNIYSGYYQPYIKYSYSSNRYVPDPNGIYSGNLLNWATMSKYDLLQFILVGGISTSRQSNINTLISRSNVWQKMLTYDNHDGLGTRICIININNANVEFTELTAGTCGYLDSPAHPLTSSDPAFSRATPDYLFAMKGLSGGRHMDTSSVIDASAQAEGVWSRIWSAFMDFLVPSAEAASQLRISGGPSSLPDGTQCTPYVSISISASGGTAPYQWDITSGGLPPGLSFTASGTPSTVISGIPTASGTYSFTLRVRDSAAHSDSKTYSISVAAATVTVLLTSPLQDGYVGNYYLVYMDPGVTSACSAGDFTWNVTSGSLPPGLYIYNPPGNYNIFELYGTPTTSGTYNFTLTATDPSGNVSSPQTFTVTIQPSPGFGLSITTGSPLQSGGVGMYYFGYIMTPYAATGTTYPCTWSITSGSLPPGMGFGFYGGDSGTPWTYSYVNGTPTTAGTYSFTVQVVDSFGNSTNKTFSLTISKKPQQPRTTGFNNVQVCTGNYTYQCGNVNGLTYDPVTGWPANSGCSNSNQTTCVLKSGLVDQVWPQARLGVMDFNKASKAGDSYASPNIKNCIEQNPGTTPDPNFLSAIENSVAIDPPTTLVNGEYESVNYYATDTSSNCNPFAGAQTCVKNFVLALTAGTGADNPPNPSSFLTPEVYNSGLPSACTSSSLSNLAINSCYGYNIGDLRSDIPGRQYVSTFIVNTMGTPSGTTYNVANTPVTTGDILKQAATNGGGIYYEVTDPTTLKANLTQAFQDIIKRAAAGTAASVLASGEGSGANLIQAVFYPLKQFGNDEITWIGRLTNFWYFVDPRFANSTMRSDDGDKILNLKTDATHHDYITSLYFDSASETTMATRWQDTNGDGIVDGSPLTPDIAFEDLGNLWEAGSLLWSRTPSSRNIITSIASGATTTFSVANRTALSSYLQAGSDSEAEAIIRWTRGEDTPFLPAITPAYIPSPDYRKRSVTIGGVGPNPWKLGDVINSTPKISSWLPLSAYHKIYSDYTYGVPGQDPILAAPADSSHFVTSAGYKGRGMVFTGANDGMLHAFRLGTLRLSWSGQQNTEKARLTNTVCSLDHSINCMTDADCGAVSAGSCSATITLGEEAWAFIPKNVLPYLRYMADANYGGCHLYSVDLTPFIFDASIGDPSTGDISGSPRAVSSWRTILIGGMRYGGACSNLGTACTDCVQTPVANLGYSSYFALDITNQNSPVLLWEFNDPQLGFTTAGPAVVRISSRDPVTHNPVSGNSGKWFVVLPSGPTGPIDPAYKQFMGRSDQPLQLFVLNLKDGSLAATVNTGISNAFAGSMYNATLDTDLNYQDNVVYVPYVEQATDGTWTDGGVGRLVTKEDPDPTHWVWSTVMDHVGPVTSAVTKLQNNGTNTLWVFFGTGRYYFEQSGITDDGAGQRQIFGVKEPCFGAAGLDPNCTSSRTFADLTNVTSITNVPSDPDAAGFKGWYINLDGDGIPNSSFRAERVITDPLASTNGVVYFTTYKPYSDQCALGGQSFLWAVKYNSGGAAGTLLVGKALIQVSTGAIQQLDLSSAFTSADGRKSAGMEGVPPTAQGLSILTTPTPAKRVLHIRER